MASRTRPPLQRRAVRRATSPIPAGVWLASAACEAIVALIAAGALAAIHTLHVP